jgi:hypothetical protein
MKLPNWVLPGSAVFLLAACALLQHPAERIRTAAAAAGFFPVELSDKRLRAFLRNTGRDGGQDSRLTIYLESDGAPWRMPDEPPADPTPLKPMVLDMAIADRSGAVAYLGRPCQYLEPEVLAGCDPALWMRARFSEDAVAAMDRAVSRLKQSCRRRQCQSGRIFGGRGHGGAGRRPAQGCELRGDHRGTARHQWPGPMP